MPIYTTTNGAALGSITGLDSNAATFLATPSGANFYATVTDKTGSGNVVFSDDPTLSGHICITADNPGVDGGKVLLKDANNVGVWKVYPKVASSAVNICLIPIPNGGTDDFVLAATSQTLSNKTLSSVVLGTPVSGTLTNCTSLPISSGVSGLGTGVATFLATPSATNLATAVTSTTGSSSLVFSTGPTLTNSAVGTQTLTDGSTIAWDANSGDYAVLVLSSAGGTATRVLNNPTNLKDGATYVLEVKQSDGTARSFASFGNLFSWGAAGIPTLSSGANKIDILVFLYRNSVLRYVGSSLGHS